MHTCLFFDLHSDDGANPMVAGFQEELDSEDEIPGGGAADLASPSTEGPDSPHDSPTEPPRWTKDDLSSDGDEDRPVVAMDEDVDSDLDVPAATKPSSASKAASQNTGWSMDITQQSSAHSKTNAAPSSQNSTTTTTKASAASTAENHNTGWSLGITQQSSAPSKPNSATSSSQNSKPSEHTDSKTAKASKSSSLESDSHKSKSSNSHSLSKPRVTPSRDFEESSSEEEQVHVMQDVEDVSDDEQLAVKPAPSQREDRRGVPSSRVPGIKEEEEEEESGEETQAVQQVANIDLTRSLP